MPSAAAKPPWRAGPSRLRAPSAAGRTRSGDLTRFAEAVVAARERPFVTFDVFDTCVYRSVRRPEDVFDLVANELAARGRYRGTTSDFRDWRIRAGMIAASEGRAAGRGETSLDAVARCLVRLPVRGLAPIDPDAYAAIELALERAVLHVNPEATEAIGLLRRRGVDFAFLSDTYLPGETVRDILGALAGDREVVTSADVGVTKRSGHLFGWYRTHRVGDQPWWHAGDNLQADVKSAQRAGVRPYLYRRARPERRLGPSVARGAVRGFDFTALGGEGPHDHLSALGASVLAPILYGFAHWLARRIASEAPDKVFFLARDGHILRQAMAILQPDVMAAIDHAYLQVSRRVLNLPALDRVDEARSVALTPAVEGLTVGAVLRSIGLDPQARGIRDRLARLSLDPERVLRGRKGVEDVRAALPAFEAELLAVAADERGKLMDYLEGFGLRDAASIMVVDIGWRGSMQRSLAALAAREGLSIRWTGSYVGLNADAIDVGWTADDAAGYVLDFGTRDARLWQSIVHGTALLEFMMSAPHGTVVGLTRQTDGTIAPVHAAEPDGARIAALETIHAAALDVLRRLAPVPPRTVPSEWVDPREAFRPFFAFVGRPAPAAAASVGGLPVSMALGDAACHRLDGLPTTRRDWLRPLDVWRSFHHSQWQHGWMAQVLRSPRIGQTLVRGYRVGFPKAQRRIKWLQTL